MRLPKMTQTLLDPSAAAETRRRFAAAAAQMNRASRLLEEATAKMEEAEELHAAASTASDACERRSLDLARRERLLAEKLSALELKMMRANKDLASRRGEVSTAAKQLPGRCLSDAPHIAGPVGSFVDIGGKTASAYISDSSAPATIRKFLIPGMPEQYVDIEFSKILIDGTRFVVVRLENVGGVPEGLSIRDVVMLPWSRDVLETLVFCKPCGCFCDASSPHISGCKPRARPSCGICMEETDDISAAFACVHYFCVDCVGDMPAAQRQQCPICRIATTATRAARARPSQQVGPPVPGGWD